MMISGYPLNTLQRLDIFVRHHCPPFVFKRSFKRFEAQKRFQFKRLQK